MLQASNGGSGEEGSLVTKSHEDPLVGSLKTCSICLTGHSHEVCHAILIETPARMEKNEAYLDRGHVE